MNYCPNSPFTNAGHEWLYFITPAGNVDRRCRACGLEGYPTTQGSEIDPGAAGCHCGGQVFATDVGLVCWSCQRLTGLGTVL